MSRKTLITVLFITTVLVFIVFAYFNITVIHSESYKYSLVNTTNDEKLKETSDEINYNIEKVDNLNNIKLNDIEEFAKVGVRERNYTDSVSRGGQVDRISSDIDSKTINNVGKTSETSVKYVDSVAEKVLIKEENIQGVKIFTYNNITYDVYSNGYKEISNIIESFEIDNSGYNGNTASLKNQAVGNVELYSEKIKAVLEVTNKYRKEHGVDILTLDKNLCVAASIRALEMSYTENLSHIRPDGAKCFIVLEDLNIDYKCAGENIGEGFKKEEDVCKAWKKSESHYKNIISSKYNKVGIGIAKSLNGRYYWVQIFSN